ncbi:iron ABC transporter permease [Neorhizobium sp. NCHU2750]|uniref:FecCD family ABC transporter permease n=1 Tax=Neorhizobium sp. NCHU2750 TaxID=1825976 RepID=UPI000EB6F44E|nr:iron ABC transporter permease [Neorhizobium sp. NCHU2750]
MSVSEQRSAVILPDVETAYHGKIRLKVVMLIVLAAVLCIASVIDICLGSANLAPSDVLAAIFQPESVSRATKAIVVDVRLPYSLMALFVGASLSLAGAEMQTILDNPLASPFTLGVSSAASFGAALAIVLQLGVPGLPAEWFIPANAFVFAFGSVLLLQALSGLRGAGVETLVLFGIALVFIFNALVAIMQFIASAEALQQLVFWSMGSLTRSTWMKLEIMAIIMICVVPFSMAACWKLTALRLGEDRARSFGIDVTRLRFFSLLRVSILAATSVSFVGTIGFIGLVGPHIARLLVGEDHRFFLPASMLCGALVMALASAASKVIVPGVLMPVGIVTSLIGVPFFLALIFSKAGKA